MQLTLVRFIPLASLSLALMLGSISIVAADDETALSSETTVSAETNNSTTSRPTQFFQNRQLKAIVESAQNGIKDIHLKTRVEMKTASTSGERKNIIDTMQEKQRELQSERKAKMENLKERMQMLARTHLGTAITRLSAAIRHFESIAERIESRLKKLNERGVNTASVETSLEAAVNLTATAKIDVEALKTLINSITDSSNPDTVKAEIRAATEKATSSVKAAHAAFIKTARELSNLVRASGGINSTTTVDVE